MGKELGQITKTPALQCPSSSIKNMWWLGIVKEVFTFTTSGL